VFNTEPYSGASGPDLLISPVSAANNGDSYRVRITNAGGAVESSAAVLTVVPVALPRILTQPVSVTVIAGQTARFSASVADALSFRWQYRIGSNGEWIDLFNSADVSGSSTPELELRRLQADASGTQYRLTATNAGGRVESLPATLTVNPAIVAPTIVSPPVSQTVQTGQRVTFTVGANGTAPLSYQWRRNNAEIGGAIGSSHTINAAALTDAGDYTVVVRNSAGSVTSAPPARLTVTVPSPVATITTQPVSISAVVGTAAGFSVQATGSGLAYRWQRRGSGEGTWNDLFNTPPYSGASGPDLLVSPVSNANNGDSYRVRITNAGGSVDSTAAVLTVLPVPAPRIQTQPVSVSVLVGQTARFSATVIDAVSFRWQYRSGVGAQWQDLFNSADVSGASTPELELRRLQRDATGTQYRLTATNAGGRVDSLAATLTVNDPVILAITRQPSSVTTTNGGSATFSIEATGSPSVTFRWQRQSVVNGAWVDVTNGGGVQGATTRTLILSGVTSGMNGHRFQCVVRDGATEVVSLAAVLSVETGSGGRSVVIRNASGSPGVSFSTSVHLIGTGVENSVAFTLLWDPALLTLQSMAPGAGIPLNGLTINTNRAGEGRAGVLVAIGAGTALPAGTNEVVMVRFMPNAGLQAGTEAALGFGDQPTFREVSSINADILAAAFIGGTVTISVGVEGDMVPRPNGDGRVSAADNTFINRLIVGLESVAGLSDAEFRRADSAPRATLGDGAITAADSVQTGRYTLEFDPPAGAGGPGRNIQGSRMATVSGDVGSTNRAFSLVRTVGPTGASNSVEVRFTGTGHENTMAFTLGFDPLVLSNTAWRMGTLPPTAALTVNALQKGAGRIGVLVAMPAGQQLPPGTVSVLILDFDASPALAGSGGTRIEFTDNPVRREVVSAEVDILPASFEGLTFPGGSTEPSLEVPDLYAGFLLRGTVGRRYRMEWTSESPGQPWVEVETITLGSPTQLWVDQSKPASGGVRLYRAVDVGP
jgi:hypothetical protein